MKNKLLLIILVVSLFALPLFTSAWGCNNQHCKVTAGSIYLQNYEIYEDQNFANYSLVIYNLDLNYLQGTASISDLGVEGTDYFIYYINNWYSSPYINLGGDYVYYEIQPEDDEIQFESTNFLGLPFYIQSCTIDCDYTGNINSCESDGNEDAFFDYSNVKITGNQDIVNLNGNEYTNDTFSELEATPKYLQTPGKVRTSIQHTCKRSDDSVKNVRISCNLAPNPMYRHSSATDDSWKYSDIIPDKFPDSLSNKNGFTDCSSVRVNMSANTFNPYNWTVVEMQDTVGHGTMCKDIVNADGDVVGQNCVNTDNKVIDVINENLNKVYTGQNFVKQIQSNNELKELESRYAFQYKILGFVDSVASIILLLYYIVILSVISGILLVKVPGTFRTIINVFKEFGKLRRY
jgi:hypothetical protein